MDYKGEAHGYQVELESEAARLIRDGIAAPWDAISQAHEIVRRRRQRAAAARPQPTIHELLKDQA